jgi:hypothetical protein
MTKCARHLGKALALLDDEPLRDAGDDIDPVQFDPAVDDNPQDKTRRALMRQYARGVKSAVANI